MSDYAVVEECVASIDGPISGVVQAAMGLDLSLKAYSALPSNLLIHAVGSHMNKYVPQILAHKRQAQSPRLMESPQCHPQGRQRQPIGLLHDDQLRSR